MGRFDLEYSVSSLRILSTATQVGHLEMYRRIIGYLKKYLKRGYAINPQPLTIESGYDKVHMK